MTKFNYQEKDITSEALAEKIGKRAFDKVIKESHGHNVSKFNIDIDIFRGGVLIVTNEEN